MIKLRATIFTLILLLTTVFAAHSSAIPFQELKLDNGLTVWLSPDSSQPMVFGAVVVKAGAADSPNTGIPHYFEHMMFKGTDKIGTTDYQAERVYLDSIEMKYTELSKTQDEQERHRLQVEINQLSIKAAEYAIPNEVDRLITRYGGSALNAYTSFNKTVYFNTFSPQYIEHWLEIYGERLTNPVFRLFQSELETVYEEKNMYANEPAMGALEKFQELFMSPSPYAYPIIGSTEHLKNPNFDMMKEFFESYYVANNMCLILAGDFDPESVTPMIKESFAGLKSGKRNNAEYTKPRELKGREEERIRIPIPIVKGFANIWRGPSFDSPDMATLDVITHLLNNSNSTGMLDKLGQEGKMLGALSAALSMNDEGVIVVGGIPKLLFQSYRKAEGLVMEQVELIKNGEIEQEAIEAAKAQIKRDRLEKTEDIFSRGRLMEDAFANGLEWEEYLQLQELSDRVTKEEIVRVANKYFSDDYLAVRKRGGRYKNERLEKPPFDPILPPNRDVESDYAQMLAELPLEAREPKAIDFESDVESTQLTPLVTIYSKENKLNDLFELTINFAKGTDSEPMVGAMTSYVALLGTEGKEYNEFRNQFQNLGAIVSVDCSDYYFTLRLKGFDKDFEQLVGYLADFLNNIKPDKSKIKQVMREYKTMDKAALSSPNIVAEILYEYVVYGDNSEFLTKPTAKKIKKAGSEGLMALFDDVTSHQAAVHYTGKLSNAEVKESLSKNFDWERVTKPTANPTYRELKDYERPVIYFANEKGATQTIVYGYTKCPELKNNSDRLNSILYNVYFGAGMESLLFQELREFRSFAYSASAQLSRPLPILGVKPSMMTTHLSTQNDKLVDALRTLDSLQQNAIITPQKREAVGQQYRNEVANSYPGFREISARVERYKIGGWESDPNAMMLKLMPEVSAEDINKYMESNIKGRPVVYIIVGDKQEIDMDSLARFGEIKELKPKKLYKR